VTQVFGIENGRYYIDYFVLLCEFYSILFFNDSLCMSHIPLINNGFKIIFVFYIYNIMQKYWWNVVEWYEYW